jgi:D-alanyl-D-alanine carboxypeptidase
LTGRFCVFLFGLTGIIVASLTAVVAAEPQVPPQSPSQAVAQAVAAGPALLIDANSGEVLRAERAGEAWYPASLTKLMTAFVVFKKIRDGQMTLTQQLPVSALASAQVPSKVGIPPGKTVGIDWALQALLVYSANDMAYVLAEGASGSIANFATEMNQVAKELGMTATHFVNPNGLFDPRHVTSARDLGVLAAVLLKEFPQHAHYFDQDYLKLGQRRLSNRNSLLRQMPESDGMKTGFVCNSGFNLVASATRNGRKLIAVVLGTKSGHARMMTAQRLLEQGFAQPANVLGAKIATVTNIQRGAIVPVDMTQKVCPRKNPALMADLEQLDGWSVSFGAYDDAAKADLALRGRLLSPAGLDAPGRVGVLKLADKAGYEPLIWGLSAVEAATLCDRFKTEGALCTTAVPAYLQTVVARAEMARAAAKPVTALPVAQGSDIAPKPIKKKKRVRKKYRK